MGIENSVGEYIIFLDSDDSFVKNSLLIIDECVSKFKYTFFLFGAVDNNGKNTYFMEKDINRIDFKDYIINKKINGEMLPCVKREIFLENKKLRFNEKINGGEGLLWLEIIKNYSAMGINKVCRIYYKDANNSLIRENLDKNKALNIYNINRLIVDNFSGDLYKFNRKSLSKNYFIMANMLALTSKKKESFAIFLKGCRIFIPSFRNFFIYFISFIDINFIIYNFLNKARNKML